MKNINYVINGVLAVAVIILFVMQFSSKKESTVAPAFTTEGDSTNLLPVAYVNVDSLLSNYNYSKDLNERILKMQEDYRLDMTQRSNALRTELNDFQRKYEANAFLTTERAQQEGNQQGAQDKDDKCKRDSCHCPISQHAVAFRQSRDCRALCDHQAAAGIQLQAAQGDQHGRDLKVSDHKSVKASAERSH